MPMTLAGPTKIFCSFPIDYSITATLLERVEGTRDVITPSYWRPTTFDPSLAIGIGHGVETRD